MKDIELPPLPRRSLCEFDGAVEIDLYTKEQMQAYARSAVEADRAQRLPDGWKLVPVEPTEEMLNCGPAPTNEGEKFAADLAAGYRKTIWAAMLASTPAQPAQKPTTSVPWMTARRAAYFMERFLHEEKMLGPNEQDALRFTIEALEAMATTHQEPPQPVERKPMTPEDVREGIANHIEDVFRAEKVWTVLQTAAYIRSIEINGRHHGIRE